MMDDGGVELTYTYTIVRETIRKQMNRLCMVVADIQTGIDGEGLFRNEMEIWGNHT